MKERTLNPYAMVVFGSRISRTNECPDPLDKIYALYTLLGNCVENLPDINYSLTERQLYERYTRATIRSVGRFWVANLPPWTTGPTSQLPSWVPAMDFQNTTAYVDMTIVTPRISATSWPSFINPKALQDSREGTLGLKGKIFSSITTIDERWPTDQETRKSNLPCLASWFDFCAETEVSVGPYGKLPGRFGALVELLIFKFDSAVAQKERK